MLVLEELETAKKRGARIYAELVGYGASSRRAPHGAAARRAARARSAACRWRCSDAQASIPSAIGYINAHGTSTDRKATSPRRSAVKTVFGDHAKKLAMSSTKSMTGHTLGAAGGIEAAIAALAIERGVLPPTMNLREAGSRVRSRLRAEQGARGERVDAAMSNSFGFGGTNAALIFSALQGRLSDDARRRRQRSRRASAQAALEGSLWRRGGTRSRTSARTPTSRCDYPRLRRGGRRERVVELGGDARGVCVCGSGIGISIAANKVAGVRAALVREPTAARLSRQHNDANVICFGERLIGAASPRRRCACASRRRSRAGGTRRGWRSFGELDQKRTRSTSADEAYMRQALRLALRARGRTSPNPLVGCVIVRDGRVLGDGVAQAGRRRSRRGRRRCASSAGARRGATVYVTLEPCNHFGRTPPCTDRLDRGQAWRAWSSA